MRMSHKRALRDMDIVERFVSPTLISALRVRWYGDQPICK